MNTPTDALALGQVGVMRASWRMARCLSLVVRGLLTCALVFPFTRPAGRMAHVRRFSRDMLTALGLRLESEGHWATGPVMLAANHVSWLDILAIDAVQPARFVSKADVRAWPLIGWMVACGGTLFIERERKRDAMRVVHQVADALREGDVIALFPEGTTGAGHVLLPFHANLLQAAVATHTPVQPVALRYADAASDVSLAPAYIGEMTLLTSVWQIVRARDLRVRVVCKPPIATEGLDRRAVSDRIRDDIGRALGLPPQA